MSEETEIVEDLQVEYMVGLTHQGEHRECLALKRQLIERISRLEAENKRLKEELNER